MTPASNGGIVLNDTARAVLEREMEQVMKDIRHYEMRERDTWNDHERVSKALREAWNRQGELLKVLRGL